MPDSPAFQHKKNGKRNTLHVCTAGCVEAYTLQLHTAGVYRMSDPTLLNLLYDTDKRLVNAGIPECQKKVSQASAFLPVVIFPSPASVFRHQGQSGTTGHVSVWHCPAMLKLSVR